MKLNFERIVGTMYKQYRVVTRSLSFIAALAVMSGASSVALPTAPTTIPYPSKTKNSVSLAALFLPLPALAAPAPSTPVVPTPAAPVPKPVVPVVQAAATPTPAPPPPAPAGPPQMVVRRVVMKDAASADTMLAKLQALQASGLFRGPVVADPKAPPVSLLAFQTAGSYILVVGERALVDSAMEPIRLMSCPDLSGLMPTSC